MLTKPFSRRSYLARLMAGVSRHSSKEEGLNEEERKVPKEPPEHVKLLDLVDRYLVDLECIREMHSSVLPVLKKQDKERTQAVSEIVKNLREVYPETDVVSQDKSSDGSEKDSNGDEGKRVAISGPEAENLISHIRKIKRTEQLFTKQSIVSLVSRYDEYFGSLLSITLEKNPAWLKSSDKTITYKELIELRSVDSAVRGVISKEVDRLLRGSHEEQVDYLDERLKLGIRDSFKCLDRFLEVAERRNLFVHTGGEVSQQYVDRCRAFGFKGEIESVGEMLDVSEDYFEDAFTVFFELGLRVGQASFRRLFPEKSTVADRALNKLAVKFLNYGDNSLVEVITSFDLAIPEKLRSEDPEFAYFARVNRAIAQKRLEKDFEKGLEGVHWSVFHPKYGLCLHVLRDEFDDAAKLMGSQEIVDAIGIEGFRTWPVFREFRATPQFKERYKAVFGEDYVPDPERDAPAIAMQEEVLEDKRDQQEDEIAEGTGGKDG